MRGPYRRRSGSGRPRERRPCSAGVAGGGPARHLQRRRARGKGSSRCTERSGGAAASPVERRMPAVDITRSRNCWLASLLQREEEGAGELGLVRVVLFGTSASLSSIYYGDLLLFGKDCEFISLLSIFFVDALTMHGYVCGNWQPIFNFDGFDWDNIASHL